MEAIVFIFFQMFRNTRGFKNRGIPIRYFQILTTKYFKRNQLRGFN